MVDTVLTTLVLCYGGYSDTLTLDFKLLWYTLALTLLLLYHCPMEDTTCTQKDWKNLMHSDLARNSGHETFITITTFKMLS